MKDDPDSTPLETWRRLLEPACEALLARVEDLDAAEGAALSRLRMHWPRDVVEAAIELRRARVRAARKFPDPDRLVADVDGMEQATSHAVAQHKAERFAALGDDTRPVFDLCCGIGGDAMALSGVAEVTAVDHDSLRAWMTERNAGCRTLAAEVETLPLSGETVHIDPSRRDERAGRRRHRYADYRPGPDFIARLIERCPTTAVKLGPGIDVGALPGGPEREVEFINDGGTLVQAVLWCGRLAQHPGEHTATRLPERVSFSAAPDLAPEFGDGFGRFLLVPDPALERSGLLGALCRETPARSIHPGLGLLTAPAAPDSPWMRSYEILETLPWRAKRIKAWLTAHDAGIVTIKTRGKAIDPDRVQRDLRGDGRETYTVFGLRLGRKITAVITRPCGGPAQRPA